MRQSSISKVNNGLDKADTFCAMLWHIVAQIYICKSGAHWGSGANYKYTSYLK